MTRLFHIAPWLLCSLLLGCSLIHDDEVVARVGRNKLYRNQLLQFVPPGIPASDSATLARQYINVWAGRLIINDIADKQLSKKEKDISIELEEYRSSLLKFRYEQHYIKERLDTSVSLDEIMEQYRTRGQAYRLEIPIIKARFVRIPAKAVSEKDLKEQISSKFDGNFSSLDSLGMSLALKYTDYNGKWIDIVTLARDFGTDYGSLLGKMKDSFIQQTDEQGILSLAYIMSYMGSGNVPPIEYCADKIRDAIISKRKYALSSTLEQELLDKALRDGNFVIYEKDNN